MSPPRRKKWSETEEKTLIDKYREMVSEGGLAKMKTREKKFKPIALYVNSMHHERDSAGYPWEWSWKDVSTKVQNMRHQYLLVKQKIKKPEIDEFDWGEGVSYWSNFLRYKEVFGDAIEDVCIGSEYEYKEDENFNLKEDAEANESRRRKKKKKAWGFVERQKKMLIQERDWEERMNQRRCEWNKTMDEMLNHHKAEMSQLQSRILDEQQNLVTQLIGVVSQWTAHPSDHTNHYLSQMMHHVNGMVHHDSRVGDNQDDQFIVDG